MGNYGRVTTGKASQVLHKYFPVLDHGFVALVNNMGGDIAIEEAARVSYGEGTRTVRQTRGLIRYLMRHRHTTPFEHVELQFHAAMPMFVARQWVRHRTAHLNEYSGRYSVMPEAVYIPDEDRYGVQSKTNRQGTDQDESPDYPYASFKAGLKFNARRTFQDYHDALSGNVAREVARVGLPMNAYTEWYWKIDLHNLFHFLALRLDPHAQWEIRQYAEIMAGLAFEVAPQAFEAFVDYRLNSYSLSHAEAEAIRRSVTLEDCVEYMKDSEASNREVKEFKEFLNGGNTRTVSDFYLPMGDVISPKEAHERLHGAMDAES